MLMWLSEYMLLQLYLLGTWVEDTHSTIIAWESCVDTFCKFVLFVTLYEMII